MRGYYRLGSESSVDLLELFGRPVYGDTMALQTHYEVHVYQNSRWSIHAQFVSGQQEMAVEEGKALDAQPGIQAVKVVREVYDTDQGTHRDFILYKSADAPPSDDDAPSGYRASKKSVSYDEDDDDEDDFDMDGFDDDGFDDGFDDYDAPKKKKKKKPRKKNPTTITAIFIKLLLVTLFSICLAVLFTVAASTILEGKVLFGVRMSGNALSNFLFISFVGSFLVCASFLAFTFMRGDTLSGKQGGRGSRPRAAGRPAAAPKAATKQARQSSSAQADANHAELDQAMDGIEEFKTPNAEEQAQENGETNERLQQALDDGSGESAPAKDVGTDSLSPHAEKQKAYMMKFLNDTLEGAETDHKKLDNFNKFGVNLFLAGACETLAQTRQLDEDSHSKVLADSVRVMGFKKSHAKTFAGKYEEYLLQDPRYMQMFQAGRNSMNTFYQDEDAAARHLGSALEEWNKPKAKEEQAGPITVLFTDIAGSTAMTQALGDAGAQKVVRAHNRVVRDALTDHAGKEIKHTGDGIMASFAKTTDGVAAAIQMQRQTLEHNQQNPDLPLGLKIGLNAGEPISEDNDLFGSTVQMSARIVDKAQRDEIFVSEIVRGICEGKGYKFVNRGGYDMKGFSEPPTLFEVVWRKDDQAAA
jgi:adenylate cyclase